MTESFYRNLYDEIFGGIDKYYAPFIATTAADKASKKLFKDLFPEINKVSHKVVPQLLSNNGTEFKHFASYIVDLGYREVNWNIGCPYPMITKKKKGAGILPYTDRIKEFLDIACSDSTYKLSVKMRLARPSIDPDPLSMTLTVPPISLLPYQTIECLCLSLK